jgi:hypothetical protein
LGSEDNAVSSASVESGGIYCEFTMPIAASLELYLDLYLGLTLELSLVLNVESRQHIYRAARQVLRLFGRSGLRS